MGVPVVCLAGDRHVGRVGASLLSQVGLAGFIAADVDGYVALAVQMAGKPEYLQEVRAGLRERLLRSPLCDANGFARTMEQTYQTMWEEYVAQC